MGRILNWKVLINRFKARLSGWKANLLSSSGRLTLIKSVLGSLGIYYLTIFKALGVVIKVLESFCASFFWGASVIKRKLGWRLLKNLSALWVKVLKSIHGEEADFKLKGCQINGLWARIVRSIYQLHSSGRVPFNAFCSNVVDGSMVRFWKDIWVADLPLCDWCRLVNRGISQAGLNNLLVDISLLNIEVGSDSIVFSLSSDSNFSIHGEEIVIDVMLLPLGGCDMVLGVQWFPTLGNIQFNFKEMIMEFKYKGRKVALSGTKKSTLQWMKAVKVPKQNA
nr:hypothetical protein [Tanacetum cinerariifolium]